MPTNRLTGSPKPGKSPRERARAVSLLVSPVLLSALPSRLAQLGRSSWEYQGSAKRFRGSQNLRSSPPGLASAPSRVGEGSRVDPCPLCCFTCDLDVAGRDTQLIRLACDSPVGTGHLTTPCEPLALPCPNTHQRPSSLGDLGEHTFHRPHLCLSSVSYLGWAQHYESQDGTVIDTHTHTPPASSKCSIHHQ